MAWRFFFPKRDRATGEGILGFLFLFVVNGWHLGTLRRWRLLCVKRDRENKKSEVLKRALNISSPVFVPGI